VTLVMPQALPPWSWAAISRLLSAQQGTGGCGAKTRKDSWASVKIARIAWHPADHMLWPASAA